jgi:hypothetical protein
MPCQLEDLLLDVESNVRRISVCILQIKVRGLEKDRPILKACVKKDSLNHRRSEGAKIIHPEEGD